MKLNRRRLLGAAALTVTGSMTGLLPRPALANDRRRLGVKLNWIKNVQYGALWIATKKGYFTEEGLEIEVSAGGPNTPQPVVSVSAGKDDIGYSAWIPFLDAVIQGNDMVAFSATFPRAPLGILSMPARPILAPKAIVGARILGQGASQRSSIEATLALNGLPNDWEMVPAGYSPEPLLAGEADGFTGFSTNEAVSLEQKGMVRGKDFHFVSFDDLGYRSYGAVLFAKREFIKSRRDDVVGFTRALIRGTFDNDKDPAYAAKLSVEEFGADYGLDMDQQTRQAEAQIPLTVAGDGRKLLALDLSEIAGPMYAAARATGRDKLPAPDSIIDLSIVEEAHASI